MLGGLTATSPCSLAAAIAVVSPNSAQTPRVPGANVELYPADHPLPTERNVEAARRIRAFVEHLPAGFVNPPIDAIIFLLSGGASAHLTLPVDGLSLDDSRALTNALLRAGAPIQHLNCVRKHLELLKGGHLARLAAPLPVHTLILSDVLSDDPSDIASGPTAADPTTFADALAILDRYHARDVSPAAARHLEAGAAGHHPETLKPGDPALANVHNTIIGNNSLAVDAAATAARSLGFDVPILRTHVEGEARDVGHELARIAADLAPRPTASCAILGGETTVTVRGSGRGGRNQELALAAALHLTQLPRAVVASFSTDGIDGPTDAAGAIATAHTVADAAAHSIDARASLDRNDSHTFFNAINALIRTGPTGTNVNDLSIALTYPS